jgi:hypothetical protein
MNLFRVNLRVPRSRQLSNHLIRSQALHRKLLPSPTELVSKRWAGSMNMNMGMGQGKETPPEKRSDIPWMVRLTFLQSKFIPDRQYLTASRRSNNSRNRKFHSLVHHPPLFIPILDRLHDDLT